ncbi:MAG TPA: NADP-dependent malic enzyme [Dongiaceae bacterium]|nr:NADP-dependent malic enzyme [Dongiaceae bacterium]
MDIAKPSITDDDALQFHAVGRPGKIEIVASKPLTTQRDLSLAYSPGVAVPCLRIAANPDTAYDFTAKGNLVAVITNGTAVLGLGDLGALASKPVMEGKSVLFKRFADIDSIDLEIDTKDVDKFIAAVRYLGPSFGGINLEDIKAPECFIIESQLRELMSIPVFHDDQHGTAIIAAAGLLNALDLTGRRLEDIKLVVNGAGAASIACVELLKAMGLPPDQAVLCDTKGVIYKGRTEGMNQWKSAHAVETRDRTLTEALAGADAFFGLSVKGAVSQEMVRAMQARPIVFAMANPDPEISPEEVRAVRPDAIIATGRSDYPNQVNNVLGFPYIFRGALDVRARTINDAMKIAAVKAIAALAREDVPDEVDAAYAGKRLRYGPEYIIPVPFDPRLISWVPPAVARAAMESGVARRPIASMDEYRAALSRKLDPSAASLQLLFERVRSHPRRVVFAEGEEEKVIRAAIAFRAAGYGTPILLGRAERIREAIENARLGDADGLEIVNAAVSPHTQDYRDLLYRRLQRKGALPRDAMRMVNQDRNVFAACMVEGGHADAMVTGVTRGFYVCLDEVLRVIDPLPSQTLMGVSLVIAKGHMLMLADTAVHELPRPGQLADFTQQCASFARQLGNEPRVALISFSNFGNPQREKAERVREAIAELDRRQIDFEYDGEMQANVALNHARMKELFPFCRLSGAANILIMPALHTANASAGLMQELGNTAIGPILVGLRRSVQICPTGATVNEILTAAAFASLATQHLPAE